MKYILTMRHVTSNSVRPNRRRGNGFVCVVIVSPFLISVHYSFPRFSACAKSATNVQKR